MQVPKIVCCLAAVVLLGAGCGGTDEAAPTPPPDPTHDTLTTPSTLQAIPADSVGVTGTGTCSFGRPGAEAGDTEENADDFVTCELEMSDPRVSGTETHDRFRYYDLGEDAFAWVVEDAVITNDGGTWRGVIQASDDGTPIGEAHYLGEGAYAGLEFHYYFSDAVMAAGVKFRGWISGGD